MMAETQIKDQSEPQSVRFNSVQQEISPSSYDASTQSSNSMASPTEYEQKAKDISDEDKAEIRNMTISVQQSHVQSARLNHFVFEPVSLPPSRVPSGGSSHHVPGSSNLTPRHSPLSSNQSIPLTPAASDSKDDKPSIAIAGNPLHAPSMVTPEISPPHPPAPQRAEDASNLSPAAQARLDSRPKSMVELSGAVPAHPKLPPAQAGIPKGDSIPPSEEHSPSSTPTGGPSGATTPSVAPSNDPSDDSAATQRPSQSRSDDLIDPRFKFVKERPQSVVFPSELSPRAASYAEGSRSEEKRSSFFGGQKSSGPISPGIADLKKEKDHHSSMSDLKRFFKFGGKKDKSDKSSLSSSKMSSKSKRSGTATPPSRGSISAALPFADDHGLEAKYGKFERMLGSGAGGSVRLMKRADGVTFAVKQFRERHPYESEKDYNKKITAEFCVGSTLHHGNVIEALDIFNEKGRWYEVMEYAPYDLFASVMTGRMSREEVACCTMQILNGLTYLHSMGLAHRDMKLDNVVVSEHGIMKIIDFGSAHVFRYPFEDDIVLASGIVGSDPYLAPEVYDQSKYDPTKVDIWSLAIIFCCMTLRRFPWKCPRMSDNSFKLFLTQPTDEELHSGLYPKADTDGKIVTDNSSTSSSHHRHPSRHSSVPAPSQSSSSISTAPASGPQTIKGPWRLLRLLPRETRPIVAKMLELNPKKRATLEDIVSDPWIKKTMFCSQETGGLVQHADNHTHVLEAGGSATPTPSKDKK